MFSTNTTPIYALKLRRKTIRMQAVDHAQFCYCARTDQRSRLGPKTVEHCRNTSFVPSRFTALRRAVDLPSTSSALREGLALSPYLTHGLITSAELLGIWISRFGLTLQDNLSQQVLKREFFHHVWRHRKDGIFGPINPQLESGTYCSVVPTDVRMAATGIPAIDDSVRQLYSLGYLSYAQRSWLASYIYHYRKVDWRAGAAWMYGHLLDGDLASNSLSWQSIAGTFGQSPLLVTSDLVERHAPELASRGTAIDLPYADVISLASGNDAAIGDNVRPLPTREPPLFMHPPGMAETAEIPLLASRHKVHLVHPWNIGPHDRSSMIIGIIHLPFHNRFPWSARRWQFVLDGMQRICDHIWIGDLTRSVGWIQEANVITSSATPNPEYRDALRISRIILDGDDRPWPEPVAPCASFSSYLQTIARAAPELFRSPVAGSIERFRREPGTTQFTATYPDSSSPPDPERL